MKGVSDLLGVASVPHLAYLFEYFLFRMSEAHTLGKCRISITVLTSFSFMELAIRINISNRPKAYYLPIRKVPHSLSRLQD